MGFPTQTVLGIWLLLLCKQSNAKKVYLTTCCSIQLGLLLAKQTQTHLPHILFPNWAIWPCLQSNANNVWLDVFLSDLRLESGL